MFESELCQKRPDRNNPLDLSSAKVFETLASVSSDNSTKINVLESMDQSQVIAVVMQNIKKTDPNTWPLTENLNDNIRTSIITEIASLSLSYPDFNLSKTERGDRCLTKSM